MTAETPTGPPTGPPADPPADPPAYPPDYPWQLVEHAFLDDGTAIEIRPVHPGDAARFERLFYRLSPESLYRRFFTPVTRPDPDIITHLVTVDYMNRLALVAVIGDEVVGVARFDRLATPDEAEAAVIVEDAWQHRGIATRLLWRLTAAARDRGITSFVAQVLPQNRPMLGLLHVLADRVETALVDGEYEVRIHLPES